MNVNLFRWRLILEDTTIIFFKYEKKLKYTETETETKFNFGHGKQEK